jgi:SET domain-containing protein
MSYKPLPSYLKIKTSKINGQGLFTEKSLPKSIILGISHIKNKSKAFKNGVARTPLGGFINHSNKPNCKLYETPMGFYLSTTENIKQGDELTVTYEWYSV